MRQIVDGDLGVNELSKVCHQLAEEKGWLKPEFHEMCALLHSEISEALEDYRNRKAPDEIYYEESGTSRKPCGIPIEFADLAIRLFHYCGYLGIDLAAAINEKLAYNRTRPFRHGNKRS